MPFIFIDNGSPSIRQYDTPKNKGVNPVEASQRTQAVGQESQNPQRQKDVAQYKQAESQHREEQHPKPVELAREIMSQPVVYLNQETLDLDDAEQTLRERKISHLPICQNGKLVGITTNIQILRYRLKYETNWYHTKVFAAKPDTDIHQCAHVMFDEHIGCLPIVDNQQNLVGLITRSDLLRVASQYGPLEFWA
ncbi:CBS domain-containing protein [Bermanella marisrubri]|uniref:CBS domain-containing protein n=1 Tax=Bermanella marisrubri TaxID=207949 RepID=Q1N0B4_9GAMM|nr:CBS domain-containing protein [Bermanella marisrubri]EAT11603.1 hypothetical protein RED65_07939 [Oceanobacter sp. RED65] [Bermanella marisrubri]QIZ83352.1 CBS domain-containing protein [Bermanella marisrubri]